MARPNRRVGGCRLGDQINWGKVLSEGGSFWRRTLNQMVGIVPESRAVESGSCQPPPDRCLKQGLQDKRAVAVAKSGRARRLQTPATITEEAVQGMIRFKLERVATPVGAMLILTDEQDRLRALDWEDYEARMHKLLRLHYGEGRVDLVGSGGRSGPGHVMEAYIAGELSVIDAIVVETGGTNFQREVWPALRTIKAGETTTYGNLARTLGRPLSIRAVGRANGANPVGVVVPCHRVIGANGSLTGYGGGLHRKQWLLAHEGARHASRRGPQPELPGIAHA